MSRVVEIVRTYLELRTPDQLRAAHTNDPSVRFLLRDPIEVNHYRRLYRDVGARWYWHDRYAWSDEQLAAHLASSDIRVWECLVDEHSAGFFELARHDDGSMEIAYFGLVAEYIGRGLGRAMLTRAAKEAWSVRPSRVWLHTCTLDSPRALPNYLARGFEKTRTEAVSLVISDDEPPPLVQDPSL